jgi:hypothetical protein
MSPRASIIAQALGTVHRNWLLHPGRAAIFALAWALGVLVAAMILGIFWSFNWTGPKPAVGFANSQWGLLFVLGMPGVTLLMGEYFRVLDNALQTLDRVVKPVVDGPAAKPFSSFLADRFRLEWATWIFPVSLATPVVFTIIADGRDIIAPLQSAVIRPSGEIDWSTVGYLSPSHPSPLYYFGFNLAAWMMQIFLGYCGMLLITLTGTVLGTVFRYGLAGARVTVLFQAPGAVATPEHYRPDWDYKQPRLGLDGLDWLFLFFVGLNLVALVVCAISIIVNVHFKNGADVGSAILAVASMVLLPLATFWVFMPYFSNFPDDLPEDCRNKPEYRKPSPWPFASEKLTWTLITITGAFWVFLLYQVLNSVVPDLVKSH